MIRIILNYLMALINSPETLFYCESTKHFLTGLFPFFTFGKIYI